MSEPDEPKDPNNVFQAKKWEKLFDDYLSREKQLRGNMARLFSLTWGQCSKLLREKIKACQGFEEAQKNHQTSWLLCRIKEMSYRFEEQKYFFASMYDAKKKFFLMQQLPNQSVQDYHASFVNLVQPIEHFGDSFGRETSMVDYCAKTLGFGTDFRSDEDKKKEAEKVSRQRFLATAFIMSADKIRYGELARELANGFLKGRNEYPHNLEEANKLLVEYQGQYRKKGNKPQPNAAGNGNADSNENTMVSEGHTFTHIANVLCYNCRKRGHYANKCPERQSITMAHFANTTEDIVQEAEETQEQFETLSFLQVIDADINYEGYPDKKCLLLDSDSNVTIIAWSELLSDITRAPEGRGIRARTNGGHQDSVFKGTSKLMPKLGEVWFNSDSLANIYSLAQVAKHYCVTLDTAKDKAMLVHIDEDTVVLRFPEVKSGLYMMKIDDLSKLHLNDTNKSVSNYTFFHDVLVGTVKDNELKYTPRDVEKARQAIDLMRTLGYVEPRELIRYLNHGGIILNSPVTSDDVRRAESIYGRHPALIKGKAVRKQPKHVTRPTVVPVPDHVRLHYNDVRLVVDYFYVNKIAFYHTISVDLRFRTCQPVPKSQNAEFSIQATREVISLYERRGFRVTKVHGDNEFEPLRNALLPKEVIIAAAGTKVPEAERSIRTVRERTRCITSDLPFKRITIELCKGVVRKSHRNLNILPPKHGVSQLVGPSGIVVGLPPVDASKITERQMSITSPNLVPLEQLHCTRQTHTLTLGIFNR